VNGATADSRRCDELARQVKPLVELIKENASNYVEELEKSNKKVKAMDIRREL